MFVSVAAGTVGSGLAEMMVVVMMVMMIPHHRISNRAPSGLSLFSLHSSHPYSMASTTVLICFPGKRHSMAGR